MVISPFNLEVTCTFWRLLFSNEKYELSGNEVAFYLEFSSLKSTEQLYYNQYTQRTDIGTWKREEGRRDL